MKKHIIDIGKLTIKKIKILKILSKYDLIIFDLDNTIFPLFYYDQIVFKKISKVISMKTKINEKKINQFFIKKKFLSKNHDKLFYIFINRFNLYDIISEKKLVNFYQYFPMIKNFHPPSLIDIIKKLKKHKKKLLLITEGNKNRQLNKIKSLGIDNLFNYKIILDGKYNRKYKPSTSGVKKYKELFNIHNSIYIGDSEKDKELSRKLGIKFYKFDISNFLILKNYVFEKR